MIGLDGSRSLFAVLKVSFLRANFGGPATARCRTRKTWGAFFSRGPGGHRHRPSDIR